MPSLTASDLLQRAASIADAAQARLVGAVIGALVLTHRSKEDGASCRCSLCGLFRQYVNEKKRATVLRRFSGELDVDGHIEVNRQRIFDLRNSMKEAMES